MSYDPDKHHRRSIRLPGYDYSQPGGYFVTLNTQLSEPLFGSITGGVLHLSDAGMMVAHWWAELAHKYPHVILDEFVVMPDHLHGIIIITDDEPGRSHRLAPTDDDASVGADLCVRPVVVSRADEPGRARRLAPTPPTLGEIVAWFKTMTTNAYIRGVKELGWPPFPGKVWQRNYYERIIRNERELDAIRRYICDNPANWHLTHAPADLGEVRP